MGCSAGGSLILRNVRPWGGEPAEVIIPDDGHIGEVRPLASGAPRQSGPDDVVVEGRGRILVPSFADVHVHLDSNRLELPFRPHTGAPGVWGMMLNDRANWRDAETGIAERTSTALRRAIERGTTRVRTYAQVDVDAGLERFEAVLAAKEAHAGRCEVEVIAFPQAGLLRERGSAQVLEQAVQAGADVEGGIDPCQLDRDPVRHLDIVFGLSEKYGVPVDIHLHEPAELAKFSTELILDRTEALGITGRVSISHGYGLTALPEVQRREIFERMGRLDVAMATIAPMSGPLPLAELAVAGVGGASLLDPAGPPPARCGPPPRSGRGGRGRSGAAGRGHPYRRCHGPFPGPHRHPPRPRGGRSARAGLREAV